MKLPLRSYCSVPPPTDMPQSEWDGFLDLFCSKDEANFGIATEMLYSMNLQLPHKSWVVLYYAAAAQYQRFGRWTYLENGPPHIFWLNKRCSRSADFYVGGHWYNPRNPEIVLIVNGKFRREVTFDKWILRDRPLWMLLERRGEQLLKAIDEIFEYAEKNQPCTTK